MAIYCPDCGTPLRSRQSRRDLSEECRRCARPLADPVERNASRHVSFVSSDSIARVLLVCTRVLLPVAAAWLSLSPLLRTAVGRTAALWLGIPRSWLPPAGAWGLGDHVRTISSLTLMVVWVLLPWTRRGHSDSASETARPSSA